MIKRKSILILFIGLSLTMTFGQEIQFAKSYMNKKAPKIVVEKWLSEKPEYKGKFVVLNFWGTWVKSSLMNGIPNLNKISKKYELTEKIVANIIQKYKK